MLGSTKDNKDEYDDLYNDFKLNSILFVESKKQVHKGRFEFLNNVGLPVLSALILYSRPLWRKKKANVATLLKLQ